MAQIALWLFVVIVGFVFIVPTNYAVQTNIDAANTITTIATIDDLKDFATSVNNGTDYAGVNVEVTATTLSIPSKWTPIGTSTHMFKGSFLGNMCNFVLNNTNNPLFGYVSDAQIWGVITSGTAGADSDSIGYSSGNLSRSNIVYSATNGSFLNQCLNSASLIHHYATYSCAAGIAVHIEDSDVIECANEGEIKIEHSHETFGTCAHVAGIALTISGHCQVDDCYNSGRLYAYGGEQQTASGIVMEMYEKTNSILIMRNCYNIGSMPSSSYGISSGIKATTAYNCFSVGDAKVENGTSCYKLTSDEAAVFRTASNISTYINGTSTYKWNNDCKWDIGYPEAIWTFKSGENNDYPVLSWALKAYTYTTKFNVTFNNVENTAQIILYLFRDDDKGGYVEFCTYYFDGSEVTQSVTAELAKGVEYQMLICKPYSWNCSITGSNVTGGTLQNNKFTFTTSSNDGVISITTTGGTLINNYIVV